MMDIVLEQFAQDEQLGLIFAEEPHLTDWSGNLKLAKTLGLRAGLNRRSRRFLNTRLALCSGCALARWYSFSILI